MSQETQEELPTISVQVNASILLAFTFLWQAWVVFHSYRKGPLLREIMEGLGADLPLITTSYLAIYRFFFLMPIVTLVMAVAVLKMPRVSLRWTTVAVVCGLVFGMLLQAWTTEAFFAPMVGLINQIG